jgi:hypothetical protein
MAYAGRPSGAVGGADEQHVGGRLEQRDVRRPAHARGERVAVVLVGERERAPASAASGGGAGRAGGQVEGERPLATA